MIMKKLIVKILMNQNSEIFNSFMLRYVLNWFLLIIISFSFYKGILFPEYLSILPKSIDNSKVEKYRKNKWTRQEITSDDKYYTYSYKFKDHTNKTRIWTWNAPRKESDRLINNYGLPRFISMKEQKKLFKKSYMYLNSLNFWKIHYNDLIRDSRPLVTGIADIVKKVAQEEKLKMREVVNLILAFCQEIPYGIPPLYNKGKKTFGLYPPPLGLNNGWIDCDSKAVLFASIYKAITSQPLVLIRVPEHMYVGVPAIPGPYDKTVSFRGKEYIVAEQTSGQWYLGQINSGLYQKINEISPVKVEKRYSRPKLPIFSESKVLAGNSLDVIIIEKNTKIFDTFKLFYRFSEGSKWKYARLKPFKDNSLKYSFKDMNKNISILLDYNNDGYYHQTTSFDMSKSQNLTLDFSEGKCIYIKSKPIASVYLYEIDDKTSKVKLKKVFKTDSSGTLRAILPSGYYNASTNKKYQPVGELSLEKNKRESGFKFYNREKNIGIRFNI